MAGYQPGAKRQKVREPRPGENVDFFQGIDKVEYNNMAPMTDASSYRYYSACERVHGRPMEDWLRFSVSLTEFRSFGHDIKPAPWDDGTNTLDNSKRRIKALFDFCQRLGVRYWTALDSDLVPPSESWEEGKIHWDEVIEYIQELTQRFKLKLMWIAPDLHSHARYNSGALTSNEATIFVHAATQIKRCLEASQRLNAECFLLWPHKEGYETIFQTDVSREIKLFAKLLKLTAEYKDRLNYRCQLLIMPYQSKPRAQNEDLLNRYMWDVTSCLYLLKNYNLERYYKVCCAPGHQLFMANVYNMLGGVVITNDVNQYDNKQLALMMKSIIDQVCS
ncbi:hypothetical protein ACJJTC_015091 [Scirpophaga incertulas]